VQRNKTRYIQVGNTKATTAFGSKSWHREWSISALEAFDENGNNVSIKKKVIIKSGIPHRDWKDPNKITNNIIGNKNNSTYHNTSGRSLLEIDLGKEYYIKNIILTSRLDKSERQNGTHVETFNADRQSMNIVRLGNSWNSYTKHIEF